MVTVLLAPRLLGRVADSVARAGSVTRRNLEGSSWLVLLSGFLEPVLYLFSIGIGVGVLVGDFTLADGRVVGYAAFVAPAMLAASAMNGVLTETTYNFFGRLKWQKLFDAIVATPEGGRILVALSRRKQGARIVISDNGEGLKPSELARALDGYRIGADGKPESRRGLGLPLARQLIEAHGGRLQLQSEKGAGTTATITLP